MTNTILSSFKTFCHTPKLPLLLLWKSPHTIYLPPLTSLLDKRRKVKRGINWGVCEREHRSNRNWKVIHLCTVLNTAGVRFIGWPREDDRQGGLTLPKKKPHQLSINRVAVPILKVWLPGGCYGCIWLKWQLSFQLSCTSPSWDFTFCCWHTSFSQWQPIPSLSFPILRHIFFRCRAPSLLFNHVFTMHYMCLLFLFIYFSTMNFALRPVIPLARLSHVQHVGRPIKIW